MERFRAVGLHTSPTRSNPDDALPQGNDDSETVASSTARSSPHPPPPHLQLNSHPALNSHPIRKSGSSSDLFRIPERQQHASLIPGSAPATPSAAMGSTLPAGYFGVGERLEQLKLGVKEEEGMDVDL